MKMHLALSLSDSNQRIEPTQSGEEAHCICCHGSVIAKCGSQRVWHWAHNSRQACDPWWENETEWHKSYKNLFPKEWHEVRHRDEVSGEIHVADVRTEKGYYIEVQHSPISDEEKTDRERFYKDLVWIVDGSRRKRDYKKFFHYAGFWMQWPLKERQRLLFHKNAFPVEWESRPVPVIFDWRLPDDPDNNLVILYPRKNHSEPLECSRINRAIFQSMMRRVRPNERFKLVS